MPNITINLTAAVILILTSAGNSLAQSGSDESQPNILFIFADDQGWNDTSVPMDDRIPGSRSDYYRTPNIERIAERGMRFSNAYAAAPMCGPSRSSFHIGKGAARAIYSETSADVQANSMTIGELMQDAGYRTAHFGKWSPGPPTGGLQFFDTTDGAQGNGDGTVDDPRNPKDIFGITERAIAFIEESVAEGRPFYAQLSHFAPHMGIQALEETVEEWQDIPQGDVHNNPAFAAMTENLDTGVGMVLAKLTELGIEDNTYVIYSSDHGHSVNASVNLPLSHGKGTLWEGGMRVPLIISGPGIAPGSASDVRTVSLDLYPTFAALAGATDTLPGDIEGGDLLPVLMNEGDGEIQRNREEIAFHFAQPSGQPNSRAASSVYLDDYKLVMFYDNDEFHLFNITEDPAEQTDLAGQMPERVDDMLARLENYLEFSNAIIPDPASSRGMGMGGGANGVGMGMGMGN